LDSATQKYHRLAKDVGLVGKYAPHSLRYAYCVDKVIELRDEGCNRSEAMALAANFLGHGDGRGRFISMVYGKTVVHSVPVEKRKSRLDKAIGNIDRMIGEQNISFEKSSASAVLENRNRSIDRICQYHVMRRLNM
jgi:hypothetical protein